MGILFLPFFFFLCQIYSTEQTSSSYGGSNPSTPVSSPPPMSGELALTPSAMSVNILFMCLILPLGFCSCALSGCICIVRLLVKVICSYSYGLKKKCINDVSVLFCFHSLFLFFLGGSFVGWVPWYSCWICICQFILKKTGLNLFPYH